MGRQAVPLRTKAVLILEDEYYLADDARSALEEAGARVIGPFSDSAASIAELEKRRPDCALLDVNLGSGISFEAARAAVRLGVPIVLMTGYSEDVIPAEFHGVRRLEKPVDRRVLVKAVLAACRT
jgi:FixJ family two-component response regulator